MSFPIRAVVFDWAGTMVDFGCMAPVRALLAVFGEEGLPITDAEARADMGKAKRDHVASIFANPQVAARWSSAKGAAPAEADIDRVYAKLEPAMIEAAAAASDMIPGAVQAFDELRALGIRIGSGSGYTPTMMAAIRESAAAQGYSPECVICSGDTPSGRPAPLMTWAALIALDAYPARACIKVDDAPVGIVEGREAGCWTIGISASGNGVGLEAADLAALPEAERRARIEAAASLLREAGADYVIEDVSQLLPVIHEIAAKIG
jgi:phosphonoacetaldehyde hydrolase